MKSLLTALQEGRLIELPDSNKAKALEYLATLIEAIPDIGVEGGITEKVMAREQSHCTGIGKGWGCPHARSTQDGELVCAVGWSPAGIDYGAVDGLPVHLVVMYFVPDVQKNAYLKEISSLAKAILGSPELRDLKSLTDLGEVRNRLLDAISVALESTAPEARARMIQLEVKRAAVQESPAPAAAIPHELLRSFIPLSIVVVPGAAPIVLAQDADLAKSIEAQPQLVHQLAANGRVESQGLELLLRSTTGYQPDRSLLECLAIRLTKTGA